MTEQNSTHFSFCVNWKITAISLIFLPLLVSLALWQLSRAEEKQTILDHWQQQQALASISLNKTPWEAIEKAELKRKVNVVAALDASRYWLLDAKMYRGKPGYHVVMPAQLNDKRWILVNRGWVEASPHRDILPVFATSTSPQLIEGNLNSPSRSLFIDEDNGDRTQWPYRLLQIQPNKMSQQFGESLPEFIIEIDRDSPVALSVDWPQVNISPAKHYGYAFQWFSMAVALVVLWFFANTNLSVFIKERKQSV